MDGWMRVVRCPSQTQGAASIAERRRKTEQKNSVNGRQRAWFVTIRRSFFFFALLPCVSVKSGGWILVQIATTGRH